MLRSIFIIFISFGIAFGAFDKGEGNSGENMRNSESLPSYREDRDRVRDNMGKSELVKESKMPRIHRFLQNGQMQSALRDNAFVHWLNVRKSDTTQTIVRRTEDFPALNMKHESEMRKVDVENEIYGKMKEDDSSELNRTIHATEDDLMSLIDAIHMKRLTFPWSAEDEHYCIAKESGLLFLSYGTSGNASLFQLGNDEGLKKSGFAVTRDTEVFIHDWLQDSQMNADQILNSFKLGKKSVNLLFVDWSAYSRCEYVYTAKNIVPSVGKYVGQLVKQLVNFGADLKKIHLIGHGMGAQIASFAAKQFADNKLGRLSGLDPAGPGFNLQPANLRLYKTDADFVDVIHTDMNFYGTWKAVGHVDFYPNGGDLQKGCSDIHLCNHQRALSYYLESLYFSGFYAVECEKYINYKLGLCMGNSEVLMGESLSQSTRGKYYLDTFTFSPYSKGQHDFAYEGAAKLKIF